MSACLWQTNKLEMAKLNLGAAGQGDQMSWSKSSQRDFSEINA
jgi:hypothetical protein